MVLVADGGRRQLISDHRFYPVQRVATMPVYKKNGKPPGHRRELHVEDRCFTCGEPRAHHERGGEDIQHPYSWEAGCGCAACSAEHARREKLKKEADDRA